MNNNRVAITALALLFVPLLSACSKEMQVKEARLNTKDHNILSVEVDLSKEDYDFLSTKSVQTYLGLSHCDESKVKVYYGVDWSISGQSTLDKLTYSLVSFSVDVEPKDIPVDNLCASITADGYSLYSAWSDPIPASLN